MSLTNLNSSNSKSMLINSGTFRSGVYITSQNQILTYTDSNGMTAGYYYTGSVPYTTTKNTPPTDSPLWKVLYIADKYSYLKTDIVPVTSGGTGANTAAAARTNLGLGTSNSPGFSNLELSSSTPFIDFHFNNSSSDYTTRLIENASGTLTLIGNMGITANFTVQGITTLVNPLSITSGGTGASDAPTARTNLGLGSASTYNIGTTGGNIPLLNTANTWTANQGIQGNLAVGTTGTDSRITISSSSVIRDNGNKALVLSSNTGTDVGNTGIFLRPISDTDTSIQINGNSNGWTVKGNTVINGTLTVSDTLSLVNSAYTIDSTGIYPTSTGKNSATVSSPWSNTYSNFITSGTAAQLYLNSTSGTINLQNSGVTTYTCTSSAFSPATTGKNSAAVGTPWSITYSNSITSGTSTALTLNGTSSNINMQIAGTTILQLGSANLVINNNIGIQSKNTSNTSLDLVKIDSSNISQIGNTSIPTNINSSVNPTVKVGANTYTLYSTGNKPTISAFRASYLTTAGSDSKQTLTASNTPQTLLVNTITAASSIITANTSTGTFLSNVTQGMMMSINAQVIRETTGGGDVYWIMFLETSTDGTTWTSVPGSNRIVTLSSNTTNEMKQVDFTVAIQSTQGSYIRIRHACTDSTKTVSVISKDSLFAGVPISSGLIVSFLTI